MPDYRYRVPIAGATAELREKGSRFLCWVEPAADEGAASRRLRAIARLHPDASHHCWAWRLGEPASERSADAGEPAGTAGVPILQVLRGNELSDVLAVVARWFGGTKLGKGGLARAYSGVVRQAVDGVSVGERLLYETLKVEVSYAQLGALKRLVHPPEIELVEPEYGDVVRCGLRVVPPLRPALLEKLAACGVTPRREGGDGGHR